jgi:MFS family permease
MWKSKNASQPYGSERAKFLSPFFILHHEGIPVIYICKAICRVPSPSKGRRLTVGVFVSLFLFSLSTYLATLAPSITWRHDGADGGDLITAAYTLGIPHPTGYPLYVLLARLFTFLPWGDIAYRVNLMSAFFAAATVPLVYLASSNLLAPRMETDQGPVLSGACSEPRQRAEGWNDRIGAPVASVTAALAFAFSPVFWSQAVIAEVYTLNAFFVALVIYLLSHYAGTRSFSSGPRLWYSLAFIYGLSLGNHLSMLLLLPAGLFLVVRGEFRPFLKPKTLATASVFFLLGLSVYLYLPLRAAQHPPINWGDPHTGPGFTWLVSARLYRRFVFALPWKYIPARVSAWSALLVQQFGWWGLSLVLIGLWFWWSEDRTFCVFSAIFVVINSIYAISYNTTDSYIYLIPSFLVMALWLGKGVHCALVAFRTFLPFDYAQNRGRIVRTVCILILCAFLLLPLVSLVGNYEALDLSSDHTASKYGTEVLSTLAANAIILTDTDPHTFALWYFRYVEGVRPDVAILNTTLLHYDWYRESVRWLYPHLAIPSPGNEWMSPAEALIDSNIESYPIYLTDPNPQVEARYPLSRKGSVYQVTVLSPPQAAGF